MDSTREEERCSEESLLFALFGYALRNGGLSRTCRAIHPDDGPPPGFGRLDPLYDLCPNHGASMGMAFRRIATLSGIVKSAIGDVVQKQPEA